ncbi:MAG: hypothetical protein ACI3U1_02880, partial [Peptococcaceae bacterium]
MFYYRDGETVLCCRRALDGFSAITEQEASQACSLTYISHRRGPGKTVYAINHRAYLADEAEGLWCLDDNQLDAMAQRMEPVPQWLAEKAHNGMVRGVCAAEEELRGLLQQLPEQNTGGDKKTVHILAMGDVGGTLLMGLALL